MSIGQGHQILQYVGRLAGSAGHDLPDEQLLERYAAAGEPAAFEMLVRRHGPVVLGVCRRVLWREQDIEDVFQAVFLVLARKAGSLKSRDLLGNWLYGVAWRIARKTRAQLARRQELVIPAVHRSSPDPALEAARRELEQVLDAEVSALPAKYRMPVKLCYLAGMSHEEAARLLRCPLGTVKTRLSAAGTPARPPRPHVRRWLRPLCSAAQSRSRLRAGRTLPSDR